MNETGLSVQLDNIIATLQRLTPSEFFDEETLRYHTVERDIAAIAAAFELDHARLQAVLSANPTGTQCWLPPDPLNLASMDAMEVYWRLINNRADERFVDGALEEAFSTGALIAALERIRDSLHEFKMRTDRN